MRAAEAPRRPTGAIRLLSRRRKSPNWITRENICLRSLYRRTSSPEPIRPTMLPWARRPAPPRPSYSLPKARNRRHYGDEAARVSAGIKEPGRRERWSFPPLLRRTHPVSQSVIHPASHAVIIWSFPLAIHSCGRSSIPGGAVRHPDTAPPTRRPSLVPELAHHPDSHTDGRARCENALGSAWFAVNLR